MIRFDEMGLKQEVLDAIKDMGFETPTPIQQSTIPYLMTKTTDIIGLAQTGTGKTAAFGLPIISQIDVKIKEIQSLVLCPTRELCLQITGDIESFSRYLKKIKVVPVYGGASINKQIELLDRKAHFVVGTPGRVLDLIRRGELKVNNIKWLVLDEADEMLNMGFKDELDAILDTTPKDKQTLLFSATMPLEVETIARKYMKEPEMIEVGERNSGAENIKHEYYMIQAKDRYLALKRIVDINPSIYGIVFCRTRKETKEVADMLIADGYNADSLHGDLSQALREQVMERFRVRHLQLLVATDVAARGLDVSDLTHIINYDLPDELEIYVHRSGRTGRAGKSGISVAIIHTREKRKISMLEKILGKPFEHKQIPNGTEVCEKQLFNLIDRVERVEIDDTQIEQFLPAIYKKLSWLSREDLIKRFVSVEFNRFLDYYRDSTDINVPLFEKKERRGGIVSFKRFFFNIGSEHKITSSGLLALINELTGDRTIRIGRIEIKGGFSFVEIDEDQAEKVLNCVIGAEFKGRRINIEPAERKTGRSDSRRTGERTENTYSEKKYSRPEKSNYSDREDSKTSGRKNTRSYSDKDENYSAKKKYPKDKN